MDAADAKTALRRDMRAGLAKLKPARQAIEEEVVTAAVQADAAWEDASTVAMYKAVGKELSVVGLVHAGWRAGKRVLFPRVEGDALRWHQVTSWRQLVPGSFGIPEPETSCPVVAPGDVDLWLVPGIAFTPEGDRLGQGGGFYDRALDRRRAGAPAWGLCFDMQVVDRLPVEGHDVAMERVLAPSLLGFDLD